MKKFRWNPARNKKHNKQIQAGYEPIQTCDDCGADKFYSHELKKWLEPRTRYYHSETRCKTIQESKKTAQHEKNLKTLRMDVVQELKSEIASFEDSTPLVAILFEILIKRKFEIDKVSLRELAAAFYPHETYRDITGELQPTHTALERMSRLLHNLRKDPDNEATLVYAKKFENGEWYYYNLQTKEEYEVVKKRLMKNEQGIEETLQKNEEILKEGLKGREEAMKKYRLAVQLRRKRMAESAE